MLSPRLGVCVANRFKICHLFQAEPTQLASLPDTVYASLAKKGCPYLFTAFCPHMWFKGACSLSTLNATERRRTLLCPCFSLASHSV